MSSYSEGQTHQLMNAFEGQGFTSGDLTKLGQSPDILRSLMGVLRGTHQIVPVPDPLCLVYQGTISPAERYYAKGCFTGRHIAPKGRSEELDRLLPEEMPGNRGGVYTGYKLSIQQDFREIVEYVLGLTGANERLNTLGRMLRHRNMTWGLNQVDQLLVLTDKGEATGLRTDGYANLFPVHDDEGNLFFVGVHRCSDGWDVRVYRFDNAHQWGVGRRVFFRNPTL